MSRVRQLLVLGIVCVLALASRSTARTARAQQANPTPRKVVEQISFDWNHSGTLTTFTLSGPTAADDPSGANRLVIKPKQGPSRVFRNPDDVWSAITSPALKRQNLVPSSKRLVFIAAGENPDARIYLILVGAGLGCCVGSLDVLTAGPDGTPHSVFHSEQHLLEAVVPLEDGSGIELIGQQSDSEARALINAQSYDPYRVYLINGAKAAKYNRSLSKTYTEAHYCEWRGPSYNERFVAVGRTTGARACHTMSEAAFERYILLHPKQFPQP